MQTRLDTCEGPDFLDAVADAELACGNTINAASYRQRAREWRQLQAEHDRAQKRIAELERAPARANPITG